MKVEFDSVEDLTANLVKKGKSEEDAEKIAKSVFGEDAENNEEEETNEPSDLEKSVEENSTILQKIAKKLGLSKSSDSEGEEEEEEEEEEHINKSIFDDVDVEADGTFDASAALTALDSNMQESSKDFSDFQKSFAESLGAVDSNSQAIAKAITDLNGRLDTVVQSLTVTDGVNKATIGEALQAFAKQTSGKLILESNNSPATENDDEGTKDDSEDELTFGEFSKSLDQAVKDEKITESEASTAETAFGIRDRKVIAAILEKIKPAEKA